MACALAPDVGTLIAFRAVQGMAAGVVVTAGQTVIGPAVRPERLGRTMGTPALVAGLAPVVGPSVGGFLLAHFSWPVLFWLNLPIGVLAFGLALRSVPRGDRQQPPPMDRRGLTMVSRGLPLLVYALTKLGTPGSLVVLASAVPLPFLGPDSPMWLIQALLLVRGAGLGLSVIPAATAAYASVDNVALGRATALVNIVALCVIVLSQGLRTGPATGFGWAFGVPATASGGPSGPDSPGKLAPSPDR
ncbi:MFS transporter [Amycolatopsis sp.]|uniref:MFS transporter n=1 Tax=Amycolatopsis sp. TaxID=37632 RepID=UPI002D803B9D|nr:MFS transporter [Amycolatopsis sp.]HET6710926.1 MFS transporter [Amycolatopsis sp.]